MSGLKKDTSFKNNKRKVLVVVTVLIVFVLSIFALSFVFNTQQQNGHTPQINNYSHSKTDSNSSSSFGEDYSSDKESDMSQVFNNGIVSFSIPQGCLVSENRRNEIRATLNNDIYKNGITVELPNNSGTLVMFFKELASVPSDSHLITFDDLCKSKEASEFEAIEDYATATVLGKLVTWKDTSQEKRIANGTFQFMVGAPDGLYFIASSQSINAGGQLTNKDVFFCSEVQQILDSLRFSFLDNLS